MRRRIASAVTLAAFLSACGGRTALFGASLASTSAVGGAAGSGGAGGTSPPPRGGTGGATSTTPRGGAGGATSTLPLERCGDGVVDPGEACDLGDANADSPAIVVEQGALAYAARPLDRPGDAALFYSYQDGSSHTLLEEVGESRLFLYRDRNTGVTSLFLSHGIDLLASGQDQPEGRVNVKLAGVPAGATVAIADDDGTEFAKIADGTAVGTWHFLHSADGGVLSGLPFPGDWAIVVATDFVQGIDRYSYIDDGELRAPLALAGDVTLRSSTKRSACRSDCSIPVCGDGVLDAGEVCDDGNTVGGDGCATDCSSTN